MRVAWITTGFSKDETDYGGAAAIHNLARELSLRGEIELVIFSLYYPVNKHENNFYNAKIYSFAESENISKLEKFRLWKRCRRKFEEEHGKKPFDIIHSIWAGESGYIASHFRKRFGIPFIANICGGELAEIREINYGSRLKFWQKTFVNMTLERADKIIAGSDYIIEKISVYYDMAIQFKVFKIPFGVDEKMFYPSKKKQKSRFPVLITIGSAVDVKAYNVMLRAIEIIKQKYPEVLLVVCGRDDKEKLQEIVNEINLTGSVEIKGFVEYSKIPEALNNSDIFILSSLYESQNLSLIEASFCGLPIVSSRVGIASEITEHLADTGNADNLADKIINVIDNYKKKSEKALLKIPELKEKFSLNKSVERFIELYKSFQ
jgi:glycosyltransferase involved in cell wall biosynthesis